MPQIEVDYVFPKFATKETHLSNGDIVRVDEYGNTVIESPSSNLDARLARDIANTATMALMPVHLVLKVWYTLCSKYGTGSWKIDLFICK